MGKHKNISSIKCSKLLYRKISYCQFLIHIFLSLNSLFTVKLTFSFSWRIRESKCTYPLLYHQLQLFQEVYLTCPLFHKLPTNKIQLLVNEAFTRFMTLASFYTPWTYHKTRRSLMFSRGQEGDQWHEMG